jgi:hypothetical protein
MSSALVRRRASGCRDETRSIGRDVTTVYFEVLEVAYNGGKCQPEFFAMRMCECIAMRAEN